MYQQQQQSLDSHAPAEKSLPGISELPAGHKLHWQLLRTALCLMPTLLIVACSSSGGSAAVDDALDDPSSLIDEQSVVTSGDEDLSAPEDVLPQTENQDDDLPAAQAELEPTEPDSSTPSESNTSTAPDALEPPAETNSNTVTEAPPPDVELSPVELFLDEIRIAAASPLLDINRKLQTGIELNAQENNCLDGFDAATGQALTSIDCAVDENGNVSGVNIYNGEFEVTQSQLSGTASDVSAGLENTNCEQSLFNDHTDACQLAAAEILLPVKWVSVGDGMQPGPIASISPIQGAAISYNQNADGLLVMQNVSDLFINFYCEIDIATASLTDTALTSGDCRQQVQRLINRLFESRTASDSDQDGE